MIGLGFQVCVCNLLNNVRNSELMVRCTVRYVLSIRTKAV